MFAIVRSLCSGWQSMRPMIFRYGYRDSRKNNTRHTGPLCESKTQFNDVHSRYKPTSFICSVRFLLNTIRARRPLRLKTKDGILMAGRWCHSSAFLLENQMACALSFAKLQKTWAVIWGDAIFLLFLVCWICFVTDRSPTASNFYSFKFMHKIFTRVVFENCKHSGSCCWDFWDRIVSSIGLLVPLRQSSIPRKILGLMTGAYFSEVPVQEDKFGVSRFPSQTPVQQRWLMEPAEISWLNRKKVEKKEVDR